MKNKLAASKYLAPWGNSSKPTDEASLRDPLSPSQHLTPIPLAERSLNVTYKCRPKGGSGRLDVVYLIKGNKESYDLTLSLEALQCFGLNGHWPWG